MYSTPTKLYRTRYERQLASFRERNSRINERKLAPRLRAFFEKPAEFMKEKDSRRVLNQVSILSDEKLLELSRKIVASSPFSFLWRRKSRLLSQDPNVLYNYLKSFRYMPINELDLETLADLSAQNNKRSTEEHLVFERGQRERIIAHGVEAKKQGGICNFLNIMLEGRIGTGKGPIYVGLLASGDSAFCAGPHGPFYVILRPKINMTAGGIIPEALHLAYLVPSSEQRAALLRAIDEAVEKKILTSDERAVIENKIMTYSEFIAAPAGIFNSP